MSEPAKPLPQWEHGYRVHGYWIGAVQWGRVCLPPGSGSWKQLGYGWDFTPPGWPYASGRTSTLSGGKKIVERLYREWVVVPRKQRPEGTAAWK